MIKKLIILFGVSAITLISYADPTNCIDCSVGPFAQVGATYSDPFGFLGEGKWVNYFTPTNPFGFEVDFGEAEFRLGGTLTHIITDQQRFKLTAEHFAQHFDFNFFLNQEEQWVGENDFGATYQYLFPNCLLNNFSASIYYSDAESENVANKLFTTSAGNFIDRQRFVGGRLRNYGRFYFVTLVLCKNKI